MSVTAQTITESDLRTYAYTRNAVFDGNRDHVFTHSPMAAMLLDKTLGDFGGVKLRGAGHRGQTGGSNIQFNVRLGKHTGSKFMAGPWDSHSVDPDDNTRIAEINWMLGSVKRAYILSRIFNSIKAFYTNHLFDQINLMFK